MLFHMPRNLGERYSPLYFLAALGSGGLIVSFFMWLMAWVPHPGRPVPIFEDIVATLMNGSFAQQLAILGGWAGIALFAWMLFRLLIWNLREAAGWRRTAAYTALRESNSETQLLAAPLAVAMAINGGFILGLVFVPGLWSVVEYLFPLAMLGFLAIGVWALRLLGDFWGRILTRGGFDCSRNNGFSQLLPSFALAMIGVGLAAPAAMSQTPWVAGVSYIASSFFITMALMLGVIMLVIGLRAMMEHGADAESAPSLWVVVPIMTVVGIALMRQGHGLGVHFGSHGTPTDTFTMLTTFLSLQLAFALFGYVVMRRQGYFGRFVTGSERSAGSYVLVCPGVALAVILQFFINKGLVAIGLIDKFGMAYWLLTALPLMVQAATIWLVFTLNAKHFRVDRARKAPLASAER
ncbi:hypothetical protein SAMN02745148_00140 [Modicisalibacter ilicicola DSM 19980]|uniref:Voltage-dependent anion channel n=1 Tax=Modicisalibacter ilicicola DSM 19980 TaxID=1121942 RepID=A0A1M4SK06_9GAMM|nr:hypothetical protein [Halomonas ilicicola]SHE32492.1 hypothetical protein SAMN02745148_00140 [Halomonas ilicicola DSM 19980]